MFDYFFYPFTQSQGPSYGLVYDRYTIIMEETMKEENKDKRQEENSVDGFQWESIISVNVAISVSLSVCLSTYLN